MKDNLVIDRENKVDNDSAIDPEDNTDVSKKHCLNEDDVNNKVNVEVRNISRNIKQFDSSEFNADVTESDRNTCKSIICEECKAEFV